MLNVLKEELRESVKLWSELDILIQEGPNVLFELLNNNFISVKNEDEKDPFQWTIQLT